MRGQLNPARGDVKVQIGDVEIILRYTLRALAVMQERLGEDGMQRLVATGEAPLADIKLLDVIIDAGMLYHHGERKDHNLDVLAEATGDDVEKLMQAFAQAFAAAFPPKKTEAAGEGGQAGPPSGKPKASTSTT